MRKAIRFTVGGYGSDDTLIVPLEENLDSHKIYVDEDLSEEEAFLELKAKWEAEKWGYHGNAHSIELIEVHTQAEADMLKSQGVLFEDVETEYIIVDKPDDTTECNEFYNLYCFTELMIDPEFYSRPFDTAPDGLLYSCWFAVDCMRGSVYSKDFAYFDCDCCNRTICEQNPSNGWMSQGRFYPDDDSCSMICNKCFEEEMFEKGVDVSEVLRCRTIPGTFFVTSELEEKGFFEVEDMQDVLVGAGRFGSQDESVFFNLLADKEAALKDHIVVFNYESMSIGGMGGYISVWAKPKDSAKAAA